MDTFINLKKFNRLLDKLPRKPGQKVVTRFPPEPSGYLHLGHLKALLLNYALAERWGDGGNSCILRFDDTNPDNISPIYQSAILSDLQNVGYHPKHVHFTSIYFDRLLDSAKDIINRGLAYVDKTPAEELKKQRNLGTANEFRDQTPEQNLELFQEMIQGKLPEGCLRLKIDIKHKNKTMRDPVIYRSTASDAKIINKSKQYVFPMYDFACPLVDSWEGITHTLRSAEYKDRDELYFWVLDQFQLPRPFLIEFSRLTLANTLLSKRKLAKIVKAGIVSGWDDPAMPTVRGLLNRGITPEAMVRFVADQGISQKVGIVAWDKLWAFNKQELDLKVPRYNAVEVEDSVTLQIDNLDPSAIPKEIPRHTNAKVDLGLKPLGLNLSPDQKSVSLVIDQEDALWLSAENGSDYNEITLLHLGNVVVKDILTDCIDGKTRVRFVRATHNPEGDFRTTKLKLTWLPKATDTNKTQAGWIYRYNPLLNVESLPDNPGLDWIEKYCNKEILQKIPILIENSLNRSSDPDSFDDQIQFQRKGYYYRMKGINPNQNIWIEHFRFIRKKQLQS